MPLSELLYRMAKGKTDASSQAKNPTCSAADLSFVPENDFAELVWEHGQIHSSRARKVQNSNSLPSQSPKTRDRDSGNGSNSRIGKFGVMESVINDIPISVPAVDMGLNQDDDLVPWLSYPIDESLQNDYGSEFLTELSGVSVNEHPQNNLPSFDKRSSAGQSIRNSHSVPADKSLSLEQENSSRLSSAGDGDDTRPRPSESHLYSSQSQQCQTSFPYFRSRILSNNNADSTRSSNCNSVSGDGIRIPTSGDGFPSSKTRVQPLLPSSTSPNLMNFSHFSRPALGKANLLNFSARAGSGISRTERMEGKDKCSIPSSSNPTDSTHMDSCSQPRMETSSSCHPISLSSKVDAKSLEGKPAEVRAPPDVPEAVCLRDESKNDRNCSQNFGESGTKGLVDGDKTIEPVVASSSVCSGNSVERASDDPNQNLKRKHRDTEESEGPSDDVEEESVAAKKAPPAKGGTGSKRSRAAEVHNLSERRRRDRINEKMRALQELIPNCNKVDKASMLDEAIEYLKTLQLQVQIMSMGAGLYMPSMMMPPGMPPIHAAHMPQFSPMGVGIGMGMGFGIGMPDMNGGSMIHVPPMHGAHFHGPSVPAPTAFHGMGGSNLQMFAISGQGLQMPYPRAPVMPLSGGPLLKPAMGMHGPGAVGPSDNLASAPVCSLKDSVENLNSKAMQNNGVNNNSVNQTSGQGQATNNGLLQQPTLLQNNGQAPEVNENGDLKSATGNDDETGRAVGSD